MSEKTLGDLALRITGLEVELAGANSLIATLEAALMAERERCVTIEVPDPVDVEAVEGRWIYDFNGRYIDAFWDGIAAYRAALKRPGQTGCKEDQC